MFTNRVSWSLSENFYLLFISVVCSTKILITLYIKLCDETRSGQAEETVVGQLVTDFFGETQC